MASNIRPPNRSQNSYKTVAYTRNFTVIRGGIFQLRRTFTKHDNVYMEQVLEMRTATHPKTGLLEHTRVIYRKVKEDEEGFWEHNQFSSHQQGPKTRPVPSVRKSGQRIRVTTRNLENMWNDVNIL